MAVNLSLLNSTSTGNINTNFQRVATALQDTVGRSGTLPNQMNADLDMNNNDILNVRSIEADSLLIDGEIITPETSFFTIADNTVTTAKLVDGAVTNPKLGDSSVTNAKVAAGANISSGKLLYTAAGTPAATPAIITNRLGQRKSVIDWGADPTGVADSTAAFENAALAAIDRAAGKGFHGRLLIPEGRFYLASRVDINTQLSILGEGAGSTVLGINGNYQAFGLHNSASRWDQGEIGGFAVYGTNPGAHGSEAGILIDGDEYFNSYSFHDLMFAGLDNGIWFTGGSPATAPELGVNFNLFDRIRTTNIGARQTERAIRFEQGSGTGNVFQNMSLITGSAGISIGNGNNTYNVGDILFSNLHCGGAGVGIQLIGSASRAVYHSTVAVDGCQFDAGLSVGLQFTRMNQFQARGCNWGGAVSNQFTDCESYTIEGVGGGDQQLGVIGRVDYTFEMARTSDIGVVPNNPLIFTQREKVLNAKQGVATGATVPLFDINLPNDRNGCYVEVHVNGLMQGNGFGISTKKFHIYRDGAGPVVTVLENYMLGTVVQISTTIVGNVVTLNAVCGSSLPNSNLSASLEVVGSHAYVKRR